MQTLFPAPFFLWYFCFTAMQPLEYKLYCHLFCEPDFWEFLRIYIINAVGLMHQEDSMNSRACKENLEFHICFTEFHQQLHYSHLKWMLYFIISLLAAWESEYKRVSGLWFAVSLSWIFCNDKFSSMGVYN